MVELTATPDVDSFFASWSGSPGCSGSDPNLIITMDAPKTCTATFTADPAITVNKAGNGDGTVTSNPAGIDCGATCSAEFTELSMVELTAVPDAVSTFIGFTGDAGCADGMVTMDDSKTCTATFDFIPLFLNPIFPGVASNPNIITVEQATPNGGVAYVWSFLPGSTIIGGPTCNGVELGLKYPRLLRIRTAGADQIANLIVYIPLNPAFENPVLMQAVDIPTCRTSDVVVNLIRNE